MIYFFTGQPGHGKTLNALDLAIDFRDKGRPVYVCNVRQFDYAKSRMLEMTPEQFRDWPNFLPDGAVCLVDECYEQGMLTKAPPGSRVPDHIEKLATHRHRGLDFIFVCQSPDKQCHTFIHDLIERHIHVRRRFGTSFLHLRTFDRFERNPERGNPLTVTRKKLPKRVFGLYNSTELDTTERRIPWYFIAAPVLLALLVISVTFLWSSIKEKMTTANNVAVPAVSERSAGDVGATATAAPAERKSAPETAEEYALKFVPRIDGQPWTAPAYDHLRVPEQPPRIFCMSSGVDGSQGCTCITDQGTRYIVKLQRCRAIARHGQYEPFIDSRLSERFEQSDRTQLDRLRPEEAQALPSPPRSGISDLRASSTSYGQIHSYGALELAPVAR